eukprot:1432294-Amphidinium_carterae.1
MDVESTLTHSRRGDQAAVTGVRPPPPAPPPAHPPEEDEARLAATAADDAGGEDVSEDELPQK